jgi:hypothetical protein
MGTVWRTARWQTVSRAPAQVVLIKFDGSRKVHEITVIGHRG